jgi:hypothetical protein
MDKYLLLCGFNPLANTSQVSSMLSEHEQEINIYHYITASAFAVFDNPIPANH